MSFTTRAALLVIHTQTTSRIYPPYPLGFELDLYTNDLILIPDLNKRNLGQSQPYTPPLLTIISQSYTNPFGSQISPKKM